jgi:hypothetical protein
MAPLVLRDVVGSMGETEGRFPRAKLTPLLNTISQEIVDEGMRKDFQQVVSAILAR